MNKKLYTVEEALKMFRVFSDEKKKAKEKYDEYYNVEYRRAVNEFISASRGCIKTGSDSKSSVDLEIAKAKLNTTKEVLDNLKDDRIRAKIKVLAVKSAVEYSCRGAVADSLEKVIDPFIGKQAGPKTTEKLIAAINSDVGECMTIYSVRDDCVNAQLQGYGNVTVYVNGHIIDRNNKFSWEWGAINYDKSLLEYPATLEDWEGWCNCWLDAHAKIHELVAQADVKIKEYANEYSIGEAILPTLAVNCLSNDIYY